VTNKICCFSLVSSVYISRQPIRGCRAHGGDYVELCLLLPSCFYSCSAYSSALTKEAILSSETSVDLEQTAQRHSALELPKFSDCFFKNSKSWEELIAYFPYYIPSACCYMTARKHHVQQVHCWRVY
jgi:hypothetical protein